MLIFTVLQWGLWKSLLRRLKWHEPSLISVFLADLWNLNNTPHFLILQHSVNPRKMHMHFYAVYLHLSFQENQTVCFLSFHVHLCSSRNKQLHTWGRVSPQITSQLWQSWCYLWLPYSLINDLQQFCKVKSIRNKHFSIFSPFCQKVVQRKIWLGRCFHSTKWSTWTAWVNASHSCGQNC